MQAHTVGIARARRVAVILGGAIVACVLGCAGGGGDRTGAGEAQEGSALVVTLVRHAEKVAGEISDAPLSDAGRARAARLAARFAGDGCFGVIVATQYRRTRETAAPIAVRCGLGVTTVDVKQVEAHAAAVAALLRERGAGMRALYVGHSNTVVPVIRALGAAPGDLKIADDEYDRLFTVTIAPDGKATLAETKQ